MLKDGNPRGSPFGAPDEGEFNSSLDPAGCLKWTENLQEVSSNSNDSLQTWRKPCFFQSTMEVSSNDSLQPIVYQSRGASSLVALGRAHHDWQAEVANQGHGFKVLYVFFRGKRRFQSAKV